MLTLKSKEEIELIRESALIVSKTLGMLAERSETWSYHLTFGCTRRNIY